jgi:hypothetical protein
MPHLAGVPNAYQLQLEKVFGAANDCAADLEIRGQGIQNEFDAISAGLRSFGESTRKEWQNSLAEFASEKSRVLALFHDHMAIHSAVKYWSDRSTAQRKSSLRWCALVIVLVVATMGIFGVLPLVTPDLFSKLASVRTESGASSSTFSDVLLVLTSGRLLCVALLVWMIRLCVRNYLSARHQDADAQERVALIQTYLAMLKDDSIAKDPDLKKTMLPAMLQTVFRHASDGYVKDDALPTSSPGLFTAGKG